MGEDFVSHVIFHFGAHDVALISNEMCIRDRITTKKEPCDVVMELSQQKAFDVYSKLSEAERRGRLVLGADTIVAIHGRILGKPKDQQDAISMLQELSGKIHHVYTGVTLLWEDPSGRMQRNTFYEDTAVSYTHLIELVYVPYYTWANRGENEMQVWTRTV